MGQSAYVGNPLILSNKVMGYDYVIGVEQTHPPDSDSPEWTLYPYIHCHTLFGVT
jgi:hypothetical protein